MNLPRYNICCYSDMSLIGYNICFPIHFGCSPKQYGISSRIPPVKGKKYNKK